MSKRLRVLIIDDSAGDALLLVRALSKAGLELHSERVDTADSMEQVMLAENWDVAISDCKMPQFTVEKALAIWQKTGGDHPFIVVSGAIGEEEAVSLLKAGANDFVKKDNLARLVPAIERELRDAADRKARKEAEELLRQSEIHRLQLQAELSCAAEVQRNLLPKEPPDLPGFEIAALCVPARQVGGDFYDWQEAMPGIVTITFGDVMGKGMAAAMLMTTVRATLRAVTLRVQPSIAVQLAEQSLRNDLDRSESFVTLFLARLNADAAVMNYVDCGHGFVFLRRQNGTVEELLPRGLPLGVSSTERYQEGGCAFENGDALIVYSDGLIDAQSSVPITNGTIAAELTGAETAREMVDRIAAMVMPDTPLPDDMTILVLRKAKEACGLTGYYTEPSGFAT